MKDKIMAFGPASVANIGPFYDVMGYCLDYLGDVVTVEKTNDHKSVELIESDGPYNIDLLNENVPANLNCAYDQELDFGINLSLYKGMPTQSGLGSSAASCVAAAKAVYTLLDLESNVSTTEIANKMMKGEGAIANHYYPDNIVPSYWGDVYNFKKLDTTCRYM